MYKWLMFFLGVSFSISAQNEGTILGTEKDKVSGVPLKGILIQVESNSIVTRSDSAGNFKLRVPVGSYNLKASDSSYKAQILFNINVTSGNASQVSFELEEQSTLLQKW